MNDKFYIFYFISCAHLLFLFVFIFKIDKNTGVLCYRTSYDACTVLAASTGKEKG